MNERDSFVQESWRRGEGSLSEKSLTKEITNGKDHSANHTLR
jgi:hypothetical protein